MKKFLGIFLIIIALLFYGICMFFGVKSGSINISPLAIKFMILCGILLLILLISSILFYIFAPKIKHKKIFRLLKTNNFEAICKEIDNTNFSNSYADSYTILCLISRNSIFHSNYFDMLINKLNNEKYLLDKYFWEILKDIDLNDEINLKQDLDLFNNCEKSNKKYSEIIKFLSKESLDDEFFKILYCFIDFLLKKLYNSFQIISHERCIKWIIMLF